LLHPAPRHVERICSDDVVDELLAHLSVGLAAGLLREIGADYGSQRVERLEIAHFDGRTRRPVAGLFFV
jgi:hypothetical protein